MSAGAYISGFGHAVLVGWLIVGGDFSQPEQQIPDATPVTIISAEAFEILNNNTPPDQAQAPEDLASPPPPDDDVPAITPAIDPNVSASQPRPQEVPQTEALPTTRPLPPVPPQDVVIIPPLAPETPTQPEIPTAPLPNSARPQLRASDRVAPQPIAPPDPEVALGDEVTEAADPNQLSENAEPVEPATAPEEATTEIIPEQPDEVAQSSAPQRSLRPQGRPVATSEVPEPQTVTQSTDEVIDEVDPVAAALEAALNEALNEAVPDDPVVPTETAGSLTPAEAEGLQFAISNCWNVGSLSTDALDTTVVVGVEFDQSARPIESSIYLVAQEGGDQSGAIQAFEAARRAILRCGVQGYDLPVEKFPVWQRIEMTFNPENMRLR